MRQTLVSAADLIAAMSIEAALGTDRAFSDDVVGLRKHPGAMDVAGNLTRLLAGSPILASHRDSDHLVQDAYSLRCVPQVHGAYRDAMSYVRSTLEHELISAIDNPSVLPVPARSFQPGTSMGRLSASPSITSR